MAIPLNVLNVIAPLSDADNFDNDDEDEFVYVETGNYALSMVTSALTIRKSEPIVKLRRGNLRRSPKFQSLPVICELQPNPQIQRTVTF